MKKKNYVVVIAERGTGRKIAEADALFEMYTLYHHKIIEFNNFNRIVNNVSGFHTNDNISTDIPVDIETFDKLYQGASLLKLPIDMTFNYDTNLWYLTIKYKNTELCFINEHEKLKADN